MLALALRSDADGLRDPDHPFPGPGILEGRKSPLLLPRWQRNPSNISTRNRNPLMHETITEEILQTLDHIEA